MPYRSINNLIILVVFLVSVSFCDRCFCQEFPYVVPEAPEFDSSGSVTTPQSSGSQSDQKKPFRSAPGVFKPQVEIGSISPSQVPTAPISGNDSMLLSDRVPLERLLWRLNRPHRLQQPWVRLGLQSLQCLPEGRERVCLQKTIVPNSPC